MTSTFRNAVPSALGGTMIRTRTYGDGMWTTFLDPTTDYKTTVYVLETWEPLSTPGMYDKGTTRYRCEVRRPKGATKGWTVALFGEEMGSYEDKGAAQLAAEELVMA